jgi:proton-translocating NADH-quinone oxidoreductase chain L
MSDTAAYLWLIPVLPLLAAAVTAALGPGLLRKQSHWPCILAVVASCVLSFLVLRDVLGLGEGGPVVRRYYTWFQAGNVDIGFTLRADALTALMLTTVTFVGSWIAIFSVGYMSHEREHEEGYARFFAEIALFIFSMTGLVLADNFLLLYAFWEGVGLCSYLLIGFWFAKPSAAAAARKAFLVTRLGDLGFFVGILTIWYYFGHTLDFDPVFRTAAEHDPALVTTVCLLLLCGAVGKSAQFPLHVWLPDAMEGPTPVSALIHAATMVTAGVYLVARCTPLFVLAPAAQLLVACIGGFTALLAALIALTQNDLKRVLAYSTLSQLGYMFLALGSGTRSDGGATTLTTFAVVAAIFHLFTHAYFKALLFLGAGSVMHAMGNVIDMRRFSGLRVVMPTTHWTFLIGSLALAGVIPFAGFWSKDEIFASVFGAASGEGHPYAGVYVVLFISALVTAGLTAFYTFRAYFLTFHGPLRIPEEAGHHAHESPPVMTIPLMVLAVGAATVGLLNAPLIGTHGIAHLLERTPYLQPPGHGEPVSGGAMVFLALGSTVFALGGIGLAAWMYLLRPETPARLAEGLQGLYQLSLNKFYFDEIYANVIVKSLWGFAIFCRWIDYAIDGLVDIVGHAPRLFGLVFRPIQNGLAQFYALAMALGLAVFLVALVWKFAF